MTYERVMFQLRDILEDKKKYMDKEDPEDVISEDVEALEQAMKMLRDAENVIYRLNSKDEVIKLQEELIENYKDHIKILNERIDLLKAHINELYGKNRGGYMSEEQKIIDLENEISFLKEVLREKQKEIEEKNIAINKMSKDISRQLEERNKKDYISKDKIREKLKKLQREEDKIYKLNYELEPVKAIDSLLLRIGDLEKLLKEK